MATKLRPITIIGGGISGLSLGVALRKRGVPVTLHEASAYPRHRVCGEFISGVSETTLKSLGIDELLSDAETNQSTRWFDPEGEILASELPEPAYGISRFRLDERLAERFRELGGDLIENSRVASDSFDGEGKVLAAGRPMQKASDWIGLKAHFDNFALTADLEMHLGDSGYLGIAGVEGGRVNVCGLFRKPLVRSSNHRAPLLKAISGVGLNTLTDRLASADLVTESQTTIGAFEFGYQTSSKSSLRALRIGDQHGVIGPFTGNGMTIALQSAECVVDELACYARNDQNWCEMLVKAETRLKRRFRRRLWFAQRLHPLIHRPRGRALLSTLGRNGMIPFGALYRIMR